MSEEKLCKTVRQYHKEPISPDDFEKLKEIAKDYRYVKNYVYQRYGGIHSLSKLYAKYTVQNEMTESGVRGELGLPSVYFYLAVFEALGDIKTQWTKTKREVLQAIKANEWLKPEEKHYLRFVIKVNACFDGILTGREAIVPDIMQETYLELVKDVDTARLNHYLCRQVRKN